MLGIACRVHNRKPRRFTCIVRSQMPRSMSSASVSPMITGTDRSAALAWHTSTPPKVSTAAPINERTEASSAMSNGTAMAVPPAFVMQSATSLAAASFRSPTTTRAPSSPSRNDVAVPMPPAPPATTATLSVSPRIGSVWRGGPVWEPHVVGDVAEHHLQWVADLDGVGLDRVERRVRLEHDVADEADGGIVLELHDDDVVGGLLAVRRQEWRMRNDHRPHARPSRHQLPVGVEGVAVRTHGPWRHASPSAGRARLHSQLALRAPGPERRDLGMVDVREDQPLDHQPSLRSSSALVGTPSPLVTRHARALSTCECDSPRNWRAPSTIKLNP